MEEDGIHARIAEEGRERTADNIGITAGLPLHGRPQIHRVGHRHPLGEECCQRLPGRCGEVGHGKPLLGDEVGGDDTRPAAQGQNGDPV